jgi:hypothetical protein
MPKDGKGHNMLAALSAVFAGKPHMFVLFDLQKRL